MPQCTLLPQLNQFNSMNNFSQNILIAFILKELIRSFFILTNLSKPLLPVMENSSLIHP